MNSRASLQARIDATNAMIDAYEAAILALAAGAESYTLDTGQTRQTVAKGDKLRLQSVLDILYNRCVTLEIRLNGGATHYVRPNC